jgi:anti-sigma factor ChrR (cupin superfamily)
MATVTPGTTAHDNLAAMAARYVDVDTLPWKPTGHAGIDIKVLMEDADSGLLTALFRWAPGSKLPLHEHVRVEQTFVLEGRLVDDEGEVSAGNFVWRPAGSRHVAHAPDGALLLGFFLKPNVFMAE